MNLGGLFQEGKLDARDVVKISIAIATVYYGYPVIVFAVNYGPIALLGYQAWKRSYDLRQGISLLKKGCDLGVVLYKKYTN